VRADVDALKTALAGTDDAAVDAAVERLQASQGKLGEAIYANQGDAATNEAPESTKDDEDIIDAEVVNDEEPASETTDKDSAK
jgi:molecular chaperone DnaK